MTRAMRQLREYQAELYDGTTLAKLKARAGAKGMTPGNLDWGSYVFGTLGRERDRVLRLLDASEAKAKIMSAQSARRD